MAWSWTNTNAAGETVTPAWGTERSNAVKQLAADIYETPVNGGDGAANLDYPLERLCPIVDGIATTAAGGVAVALGVTLGSVDDYRVELAYQEDPGNDSGDLFVVKTTSGFTIKTSGNNSGIKVAYAAKRVVS